jgi:hypothetical protein
MGSHPSLDSFPLLVLKVLFSLEMENNLHVTTNPYSNPSNKLVKPKYLSSKISFNKNLS